MCTGCRYEIPKRISGPLLDRIDIHIEVPRVDHEKLRGDRMGESSESIRSRVQDERDIQLQRFFPGMDHAISSAMRTCVSRKYTNSADFKMKGKA
jgi:magnesium chelatase family protein